MVVRIVCADGAEWIPLITMARTAMIIYHRIILEGVTIVVSIDLKISAPNALDSEENHVGSMEFQTLAIKLGNVQWPLPLE